jgi:vacuolar-type H+-ATPase subunit I/STV1
MDMEKEKERLKWEVAELKEKVIRNISQSKRLINELKAQSGVLKTIIEYDPEYATLMRKSTTEGINEFILSKERYSSNDKLALKLLLDEGKINEALDMTVRILRKYVVDVCEVELAKITTYEEYL